MPKVFTSGYDQQFAFIGMALFCLCSSGPFQVRAESDISTSDPVIYSVRMTTSLRIPGGRKTSRLRVWHALPPRRPWSLFTGEIGATGIQFSSGGKQEYLSAHNSHHILWEMRERLDPGETHRFLSQFEVRSMRRVFRPGKANVTWEDFAELPPLTKLASEVRAEDVYLPARRVADKIKKEMIPGDAIPAFCNYIRENVKYDAGVDYSIDKIDAIFANQRGHCGHQAAVFRQLCGAVGIPVRTVRGLNLYEEDGRGELHEIRPDYTNIHIWNEVYIPEVGWVEVDPVGQHNPFAIPSHLVRNNDWFQNYTVWVNADGEERQPTWTPKKGKFVSEYHIEHIIEFRSREG